MRTTRSLSLLSSLAFTACAGSSATRAPENSAPARVVPYRVEERSGRIVERFVGVAYIRSDRIDVAVTDAQLAPDTPNEHVQRVRAILVKGDPETSWDVSVQSSAVSVERLRALATSPADTVHFVLKGTGGEPLGERRLSFWLEAQIIVPGRGPVTATRPVQGTLGNLSTP